MPRAREIGNTLWVGGSSSLARTYVNEFGVDDLLLVGAEASAPSWVLRLGARYRSLDLTALDDVTAARFIKESGPISTIVVGVRPLLFAATTKTMIPQQMIRGIRILLENAFETNDVRFVLHISSVAAVDHLRSQSFINEDSPIPPSASLRAPYDLFKRGCETSISGVCEDAGVSFSHLRLSAIFSDDRKCIQCSALELQSRIGAYIPVAIDCNSSVNVAYAIDSLIREHKRISQPVYYYTRPRSLKRPVPYGYYLMMFRKAYEIEKTSIWIPAWVVDCCVALVHWIAGYNNYLRLPYLDSVDYLLQVSSREHSFDCRRFQKDFPNLKEESILECFLRRKLCLEQPVY